MSQRPPISSPPSYRLLGVRIHDVTYQSAVDHIIALTNKGAPSMVSACNTHLVTVARMNRCFARVMESFDLVVPDGFPLIWGLNLQGAGLTDRVYGPYLMRETLRRAPRPWKHFFFGGKQDCLDQLVQAARQIQPDIDIAGTYSPPFREWTEADEADFARIITESGADFIWVALGGERQERWITKNLHRYQKGVFFAVGDAFELLAGRRPFAPPWMQQHGLTWLYRLYQEPKRLWARYLKFNFLFLYYAGRDAVFGTPRPESSPTVAFLGSRGVPARYSGFEVVVEELGSRLAERGYDVTVYNRYPQFRPPSKIYRGMETILLPTIRTKTLDTIVHTFLSALHAIIRRYELIYLCGVGNAIIGGMLRACGMRVIINVDGADFRRAKWSRHARFWLRKSESWAANFSDIIIADNGETVRRYERELGVQPVYLSYGCLIRETPVQCGELERWGLQPRGYILFVSRLTPENEALLLVKAFVKCHTDLKLVICGGADYEAAYYRDLVAAADHRVIFTGARYGDSYLELSQNALFFVMPASIEATRLVLLDQMGMGSAILYKDCPATREVVGDAAEPFAAENPVESLAEKILLLAAHPDRCKELGQRAQNRARTHYDWNRVVDKYEKLFADLGVTERICP